jgi:allophanate hydrolase subunit 1
MTKMQMNFRLLKPLDEGMMERLSDESALYGIQQVKLAPALDSLMVEYDATRLRPAEVEKALSGAGLFVEFIPAN